MAIPNPSRNASLVSQVEFSTDINNYSTVNVEYIVTDQEHLQHFLDELYVGESIPQKKALVHCPYCDSWAALYTKCTQCGGTVTDGHS